MHAASANEALWQGRYEPISRACERSLIAVGAKTVRYGRCAHSIVETLANTTDEFAVVVKSKCGWSGAVMSLKPGKGQTAGLVDFRTYESRDHWNVGHTESYCAYGNRQQ